MDMGPLWAEIMDSNEKFSLFSGHDSTIFPLMASLGERAWNATDFPAYASMMLIEVGSIPQLILFRLEQNSGLIFVLQRLTVSFLFCTFCVLFVFVFTLVLVSRSH